MYEKYKQMHVQAFGCYVLYIMLLLHLDAGFFLQPSEITLHVSLEIPGV